LFRHLRRNFAVIAMQTLLLLKTVDAIDPIL
jgi:hypothetical protein